ACHTTPKPAITPPSATALPGPAVDTLQQLQHDLDTLLAAPALERGTWGVLVRSLSRDDSLYSLNAHKLMMPASNMKIVTLAVAAERLGWDFSYETRLVADGAVHDGVLEGDL